MLTLEPLKTFHNQLEPQSLIDTFIENPPENFEIEIINASDRYLHAFSTDFDLLTTIDESLVEFVNKLRLFPPFNYINRKILTPNVTFIGTTVSEYSLFPENITSEGLVHSLLSYVKEQDKKYFIIKDIPLNSSLLSNKDNNFSKELMKNLRKYDFEILSGQALAYLPINFNSLDGYLELFSSKRRNDLKRKMKSLKKITIREYSTGDEFFTSEIIHELYNLYINVYNNSYVNFDKLTLPFFKHLLQNTTNGKVFIYSNNDRIIGFNLCFIFNNKLMDKYSGFLYPDSRNFHLFFNHFFDNINYCIKNNLDTYIVGCSAPRAKAYLGCNFTFTYHAVYIKNPILRYLLKKFKHLFEFDKNILSLTSSQPDNI